MTDQYDVWIREAVAKYLPEDYDWRLFKAQLFQESGLDPTAESPAGAVGLGQFMEGTWAEWSKRAGFAGFDRTHAKASIFTAARYMEWLISEWGWPRPELDRYCLAMASYNAGLGNILRAQAVMKKPSLYHEIIVGLPDVTQHHSRETVDYVKKVLSYYGDYVTCGDV